MSTTTRSPEAEFTAFVAQSGPGLHRTAHLLTGDAHRAEELVQATLVKTYLAWPRACATDPEAYARRVLANQRIDTWRKHRREVLVDPVDVPDAADATARASADPVASAAADRDEVIRALLALTPRQRRVVVLRHLVGLSDAEVAADLGVSVGTVKSTASRALAQLRARLLTARTAAGDSGPAEDGAATLATRLSAGAGHPATPDAAAVLRRATSVRRRRRSLVAGAMAALVVVGIAVTGGLLGRQAQAPASADWPVYGSLAALAERADLVVEGTVLDERREDLDIDLGPREDLMPVIVYRIEVARAYLGDAAPGDVVEVNVMAPAGRATEEPRLDVGRAYVLFLAESFDGRPRAMLNPFEAAYVVADDGRLDPVVDSEFALTVTRADLDALAP